MPAIVLDYCTFLGTVLSTVQYLVRLKMFSLFLFLIYCLCEKYYKTITVKYYIADCVSWVPRLTLLDLSLGLEVPLEKGMAIHSSILPWRIPWTEKSGGLQSVGLQRAGYD